MTRIRYDFTPPDAPLTPTLVPDPEPPEPEPDPEPDPDPEP